MNIYCQIIVEFKTAKNLAIKLNVNPYVVYRWKHRKIPMKYILEIEYHSKRLTRNILRPDVFGDKNA